MKILGTIIEILLVILLVHFIFKLCGVEIKPIRNANGTACITISTN